MKKKVVIKEEIVKALKEAGLKEGMNVIVHTSLGSLGYVSGGAKTVIDALIETVGDKGTIMMPTQSWKNLDPDTGVHYEIDEKDYQLIRDTWPAYDKDLTPTNTMGAVAEMFRQYKGAMRSNHPARSLTALGQNAEYLISRHDLSDIFGETSPLARLYELGGYVLLIGVGYDKNTSLHLCDERASYPSKHYVTEHSAIMEDGKRVWKAYDTLYVDGEDFKDIGEAFESEYTVNKVKLNDATIRLMSQRELVDFGVKWIEKNRK